MNSDDTMDGQARETQIHFRIYDANFSAFLQTELTLTSFNLFSRVSSLEKNYLCKQTICLINYVSKQGSDGSVRLHSRNEICKLEISSSF